jgi:hypothetical protein
MRSSSFLIQTPRLSPQIGVSCGEGGAAAAANSSRVILLMTEQREADFPTQCILTEAGGWRQAL